VARLASFRRTIASNLYELGADEKIAQRVLLALRLATPACLQVVNSLHPGWPLICPTN
jgi:hypothetical protein